MGVGLGSGLGLGSGRGQGVSCIGAQQRWCDGALPSASPPGVAEVEEAEEVQEEVQEASGLRKTAIAARRAAAVPSA